MLWIAESHQDTQALRIQRVHNYHVPVNELEPQQMTHSCGLKFGTKLGPA